MYSIAVKFLDWTFYKNINSWYEATAKIME